jgi:tetratricopeptide (TPR) repeat protein
MVGLSTLAEILKVKSSRLGELAGVAWKLQEQKRNKEARALFRGLATLSPEDVGLHLGLALSTAGDQDYNAAADAADMAIQVLTVGGAPESQVVEFQALKTSFLVRAGRKAEAGVLAQQVLARADAAASWREEFQTSVDGLVAKVKPAHGGGAVVGQAVLGRVEEAQARNKPLAWVLGYSDQDLMGLYEAGNALIQTSSFSRARRVFEGLVALDPGTPLFHLGLALSCELLGDITMARQAFDAGVTCARGVARGEDLVAGALVRRGEFLARHGLREEARRDVEEAFQLPASALNKDERATGEKLLAALGAKSVSPSVAAARTPAAPPANTANQPRAPPVVKR